MGPGPGVPAIVPSYGPLSRRPLPSTGSRGAGSPASAVLRGAPTPDRPSRRASLPSLGGTSRAPLLRSRRRATHRRRAWVLVIGPPTDRSRGDDQVSQVPGGTPMRACPALRPRRDLGTRPLSASMRPSARSMTSAPATIRFSGLHPTACTLPVYASQGGSLLHHATLGSGWWPTFAGWGWLPTGFPPKGFDPMSAAFGVLPSQAFSWRNDLIRHIEVSA